MYYNNNQFKMSYSKNSTTTTTTTKKVLEYSEWNPKQHKFMAPKVTDKGGKSVFLLSTQTSRSLHVNTPLMMTWGVADFANDDGTSDGRFKITLNFPNPEYKTADTDVFLAKMIEFQSSIIDDAVTFSELWFGKKKSRELVEDSFFPFIKYPKVKDVSGKSTGIADTSRPPSISAKVPRYENPDGSVRWEIDLFDTNYNQIFPSSDPDVTPVDLIPKLSKIACTLQCTGIWVGGKGWGLTWKIIGAVVKQRIQEDVRGVCHIKLTDTDKKELNSSMSPENEEREPESEPVARAPVKKVSVIQTAVEDSDDEVETKTSAAIQEPDTESTPEPEVEPVSEAKPAVTEAKPEPVAEVPKKVVKKVVKKKE
uniref:Uncharacterized protein n=1 Tax=viral metagenome TaxID=1070528 RepID=A0A6C0DX90_9ZZZZ